MADLLSKEMIADLIINIINIVVLFLVTRKLLYKPVKKVLEERKAKATQAFDQAEQQKKQAQELKMQYEQALNTLDEQTALRVKSAEADAQKAAERILQNARAQAESVLQNAQTQAQKQMQNALAENKQQIVDAVCRLSSEILVREVSDADNMNIINSFFK